MVFESYGVEKLKCDSHIDSITYVLRFNRYVAPGVDEKTVNAVPHTDKSLITILAPSQVNGLEVNLKDEQWIPVDFLPSSFIVMAADALMVGYILFLFLNLITKSRNFDSRNPLAGLLRYQ